MKTVQGQAMLKLKPIDIKWHKVNFFWVWIHLVASCGSWILCFLRNVVALFESFSLIGSIALSVSMMFFAFIQSCHMMPNTMSWTDQRQICCRLPHKWETGTIGHSWKEWIGPDMLECCWWLWYGFDFRTVRTGKRSKTTWVQTFSPGWVQSPGLEKHGKTMENHGNCWHDSKPGRQPSNSSILVFVRFTVLPVVQVDARIQGEDGVPKQLGHNLTA